MLNFDFYRWVQEKLLHRILWMIFQGKYFFQLTKFNCLIDFISWDLGNMCIVIICYPVCNVMNLEFNFRFLIKPFFHKNLNVLRTKRAYEKGFSSKQIKKVFLESLIS